MLPAKDLLHRYNVPVPRYTSYPTVPYWEDGICTQHWLHTLARDMAHCNASRGISLYIHLPFCESLCTYCGCNKKITSNHSVEEACIAAIHNEWNHYKSIIGSPVLAELHLGGGTPTFFSPANLQRLLAPILKDSELHSDHEFSFEGHPNNTTPQHLQTLFDLGFRRVSFGVQDNDPIVQQTISRIQPFANVQSVTATARAIGYTSVNFDLIYGLPRQSLAGITQTIRDVISLRPDRIAFYSYAHVPWTSKGQRLFDEHDLPGPEAKRELYLAGKSLLCEAGYHDVGMDHFALPTDSLYQAQQEGRLHRNFMGYTAHKTDILLGLGMSAISSTPGALVQNEKSLHGYYHAVNGGHSAVTRGIFLTDEDRRFGRYITDLSCKGYTKFLPQDQDIVAAHCLPSLGALQQDGLIDIDENKITITPSGHHFIRNICAAFDLYLARSKASLDTPVFSKAV